MERQQAMRLSRSLRLSLRLLALAAVVALAGLVGEPANALEGPPGSKNFTPPRYVPNYFSNESGSFRGGSAAGAAQPGAGPVVAAPAPYRKVVATAQRHPRYRHHAGRHHVRPHYAGRNHARVHHARRAATAHGRFRLARGQTHAHRHVLLVHHPHASRSGKPSRAKSAHAPVRHGKTTAVSAKSRHVHAKVRRLAQARD
jgi:hypothetical protein